MSIPLDRLYHWIEELSKEAFQHDVLIYRFYPYGSKKIEHLTPLRLPTWFERLYNVLVYCNDQEPLDFDLYQKQSRTKVQDATMMQLFPDIFSHLDIYQPLNFRLPDSNCHDLAILLHSEQRSDHIEKYRCTNFVPVYYWSHAVIARDWFRYAEHEKFVSASQKQPTRTFRAFNRAWLGSREYRLKFLDLLVSHALVDHVATNFNPKDSGSDASYQSHAFRNPVWKPSHVLEDFFPCNQVPSTYSAEFDRDDYDHYDWEVVLETLFDDGRIHLTEKTLRPLACGQPFLLLAPHGSLQYLRSYGFRTFHSIIDETYDTIVDPYQRMQAVIAQMQIITRWTDQQRASNMTAVQEIVDHNRQRFFSSAFAHDIEQELRDNLRQGHEEFESRETGGIGIRRRAGLYKIPRLRPILTGNTDIASWKLDKKDIMKILTRSRKYYNRWLAQQHKP